MNVNSREPKGNKKRKPAKECPNPLFLKWLERWRDEAKAKDSKLQYVYNKVQISAVHNLSQASVRDIDTHSLLKFQAVSSMKKYPLPLESGKEAMILDGIGKHLKHLCRLQLLQFNRPVLINHLIY